MSENGSTPSRYATAGAFRQRATADVTLPSGLLVQVRYVRQVDLLGAWDLPLPGQAQDVAQAPEPDVTPDLTRRTLDTFGQLADAAIVAGCVQPRFVARGACADEGEACLADLDHNDYCALADAILRHSGVAPEVAAALDGFRTDQKRPAGGADGPVLSGHAPPAPADDASRAVPEPAADRPGGGTGGANAVGDAAATDGGHAGGVGAV